ncbi:hypothetical protein CAOG_007409 [Capsaspora owczarzaki ATCC 30864]|uniref:Generative cell specific-1/HAP2 domain-containing protein n=1 Tax=Capsaspora owczarzaki (strain ATCC 30864) TaxID=595528 RepID=A0A0D2WXR0_CAPO3|nr:hypothetical protein CAOG_007409 [Capsaspora owczarzaki ATCC 30864]
MRFDQLWYNVVALDPPQMAVKFTFTIFTGSENKTITVSPSQRTAKNSDGSVIVRLIGSFQSFVADYDLTTNYLLIPQPATSPTSPQVALGRSDWMLVPKSTVDLTGATCDKIGVGFTPFRYQEGQCTRPSGSCLNNQPKDFWTADTTLRRQGKMVNYFLERYGDILGLYAGASDIVSMSPGQQYVLATRPRDPASILFTMEIAADSLTFYNNLGQASIKVFSVTDFESLSQRGTLRVLVASETPLEALYAVRVVDCVPAIFPIAEQSQSIGSYQAKWYTFTLQTMTPIGGNTNCTILLVNSNSDQLDKKFVSFRTNSTTIYKGNQGGSEPGDDDDRGNDPSSGLSLNFLGDAAKWLADAIASGYGVVLIMGLSAIVLAILRGCARCCCKLGVSEKHKDRSACVNFFHDLLQICLLPIYLIKYIIDIFRKPPPPDQDDMNTRRFDERSAPRASFDEEGRWSQRLSTSPQDSPSSHSTTGLMGPSRGPMTESASRRRLQFDSARNSDASATSSTSRSAMIGHTVLATSRKVGRTLWNAVRAGSSMLRARLARDAAVGSEASQAPTWTEMEQTRRAPLEPTGASDVSRPRQTMPEHATANQNRAVSSHRPRTTLSRAELQILARSNRPVYFNFRRVRLQEIGSQIFVRLARMEGW